MLSDEYKRTIENDRLKQLLLRRENLPVLEEVLARESAELERLQRLKKRGKLDFGKLVKEEEVPELLAEIYPEVDYFLGFTGGNLPSHQFYSRQAIARLTETGQAEKLVTRGGIVSTFVGSAEIVRNVVLEMSPDPLWTSIGIALLGAGAYALNRGRKMRTMSFHEGWGYTFSLIELVEAPRSSFIPTTAHEYAHHLQQIKQLHSRRYLTFLEGHARGVERTIAEHYREKEDNEAFLWDISNETVEELKLAYQWICAGLGEKPKRSLGKTRTQYSGFFTKQSHHTLGNTLFRLYEALHGKDIYRQAIHGEFQFQ